MSERKQPQSFAALLADADGGTINEEISRRYEAMREELTDRASLHEDTFSGEITIRIKVAVEGKSGKIGWKVDAPVKVPPLKMPGARFFTDLDGRQTRQDPRVADDLFEARRNREDRGGRPTKSASAPEGKG